MALNIRDWVSLVGRGSSLVGTLLRSLGKLFTPHCPCVSDETLKTVGPFYLVSMPGEVKYPTQG